MGIIVRSSEGRLMGDDKLETILEEGLFLDHLLRDSDLDDFVGSFFVSYLTSLEENNFLNPILDYKERKSKKNKIKIKNKERNRKPKHDVRVANYANNKKVRKDRWVTPSKTKYRSSI